MIWILCFLLLLPLSLMLLLSNIFIYSSYRGQGLEPISPFRWILSFMIPLLICKWGLHKKHLCRSGAAAAFAVGFIMTLSNYCFMTSMIVFFIAGSMVTKWRSNEKRKLESHFNGTNGGISAVGTLSSVFGGFAIGLTFLATLYLSVNDNSLSGAPVQWPILIIASLAGFIGSIVDSLLGATLQFSGLRMKTGCIVESPDEGVTHISGYPLLNNHGVNLLSSVILCIITPQIAVILWNRFA